MLTSLFSSVHCPSFAFCPGSFCSGVVHGPSCTGSPKVHSSQHLWGKLQPVGFRSRWIRASPVNDQGTVGRGLYMLQGTFQWDQGPASPSMTSLRTYSCFGFSFSWSLTLVPCDHLPNKPPTHKSLNQALLLDGAM